MPIEVRELVIRTKVETPDASAQPGSSPAIHKQSNMDEKELNKIVNMCVEKVIGILKRQKAR